MAALLSALVPGAGQWYAGHQRRAIAVFAPTVALVLVGAVIRSSATTTDVLSTLVQPKNLWALLVGNAVVLIWRLFAVVDAAMLLGSFRGAAVAVWTGLIALALVVAAPHVLAAVYSVRGISVLENVFAEDEPVVAAPATTTTTVPTNGEDPEPEEDDHDHPVTIERDRDDRVTVEYRTVGLIFREGVGDPDAIAIRRDLRAEAPAAPFADLGSRVDENRITILLAGGDRGPGRDGLRTDTMIVATIDITTGQAALFGLPRNYKRVPLPDEFRHRFDDLAEREWEWEADLDEDGFPDDWVDEDGDEIPDQPEIHCHCFADLLNHLHGDATGELGDLYPNSKDVGMDALADTLGNMIGLPIDYWMLVDMRGFVRLIDAMGGVDVWVNDPLHVGVSPSEEGLPTAIVNVQPGMNHLTGSEALAYVRWRRGSSDYARMQRQRCLIRSVVAEADPITMLRSFTSIADAIEDSVVTNIPLSFLPDLVEIVGKVDLDEIATLGLIPPRYSAGRTPGRYPIPDVDRMRAAVNELITNGAPETAATTENECGV